MRTISLFADGKLVGAPLRQLLDSGRLLVAHQQKRLFNGFHVVTAERRFFLHQLAPQFLQFCLPGGTGFNFLNDISYFLALFVYGQ